MKADNLRTPLSLNAVFTKAKEGGYIAYIAEIEGVNTQGETLEEAKENLIDAFKLMVECRIEEMKEQSPDAIIEPFVLA